MPTRYPNDIGTGRKGTALANFPGIDPTKVVTYFNDFTGYTAGDWTITRVGVTPTEALSTTEENGVLTLTMAASDNSSDELQLVTSFTPSAAKKIWFKTRFKISDATESDFLIGLASVDTTLLGATAGDGVTDGIFFAKDDGATGIYVSVQKDTTTGQNQATSIATATTSYVTLGFEYDGKGYLKYFVDDVHKGTLDASSTYFPNTALRPSIAMMNGEAVSKIMNVDYIFVAYER